MEDRLTRFTAQVKHSGADAALVTRPENIRYLTGYAGEGALMVGGRDPVILTDFRYTEQVGRQAPDCLCVRTTHTEKLPSCVRAMLETWSLKRLAIEPSHMTVAALDELKAAIGAVEITKLEPIAESMRAIKDQAEIDLIIRAAGIASKAFDALLPRIKPGVTEREIALELNYLMLRGGAEAVAFETIACAGPNGSLPHAVPSDRPIRLGELLTLDFGAQVEGYKSDMTRTVAIGAISDELTEVYRTVRTAQEAALKRVMPGAICSDVDAAARSFIEKGYPGTFGHGLGHGVGLMIHEQPWLRTGIATVLVPGHVVTVEPGIYLEGMCGCRIEDTVILREGGIINPITATKDLIIL